MRLSDLLALQPAAEIAALARRIIPGADDYPMGMWATSIENVLRGSGHVEHVVVVQRPPVLALLVVMLEAEGRELDPAAAREAVLAQTDRWGHLIEEGEIGGDDRFSLYRRLLAGAWTNDLRIDASESALLGLLRRELRMTQVDHYLVAHHPDVLACIGMGIGEAYAQVLSELVDRGVLYETDGKLYLPDELVVHVRRALGVAMERDAARRLLDHLGSEELRLALGRCGLRMTGSKPERIERLVESLVPPGLVLDEAHIHDLKDLARKLGLQVAGSKEETIRRLMDHFDSGADQRARVSAPEPEVAAEPKELERTQFVRLFEQFTGHQLKQTLITLDLRHAGAKQKQIETLWESPFAEGTILRKFSSPDLQNVLESVGADKRGSKDERVLRLIRFFSDGLGQSA